jgi:hypothetical protein
MFLTRHGRCQSAAEAHGTTRRVLGLASIAVGLTEILSPKTLEDTMGINNGENTGILRVLGIREISHGIDLLAHKDPTTGVLARVAGDLLDGVLLTAAAQKSRNPKGMAAIFALVTPIVLADMLLAPHLVKDHAA